MAETNMVNMGVSEATTEQSKGVVSLIATKKEICVKNSPNIEAKKIFTKSRFSTLSFGKNRENKANKRAAPVALKQNNDNGGTMPDKAILRQATILNPKIQ